MLSGVGNKIGRRFGIVFELGDELVELYRQFGHAFEDANGASGKRELPVPGTFLVDKQGTIRLAHVDVDYTRRLDLDDVIGALKTLSGKAGTTVTSRGLEMR